MVIYYLYVSHPSDNTSTRKTEAQPVTYLGYCQGEAILNLDIVSLYHIIRRVKTKK